MSDRAQRLADSEAFALAPVAYSVLDPDGRQLAANPAFHELFRTEAAELTVEDMTHETDQELTASYLAELVSGERARVVVEKRYRRGDGSTFWGRLTATALHDERGRPELLIGVIDDVTPQVDTLAAVTAASEAKSAFVARVSHDLRTPLHAIRGLAELLTLAEIDPTSRGLAEAIQGEAETLRVLVDDLLDLSRLEAGQVELSPAAFPLDAYIRGAVELLRDRAAEKGLDLEASIDPAVEGDVWGDGERLRQVLVNLIDNAVKFTSAGAVRVGARRGERDEVIITVRDTGTGIDPEMVDRVFEPFGRAHHDVSGTGLGLTISRDLIHRMGGALELESTPGHGTLFTIRVPLPPALDPTVAVAPIPLAREQDARPPIVLVVEDSPINQLLAAGQLDQLGCRHDIAATGMEALAAFTRRAFDVVLMDWHLPDIDGLETTRLLREMEKSGGRERVPVIAVTARTMTGDRQRCLDAGMDDFLPKPVGMEALADMLRKWLPAGVGDLDLSSPLTPAEAGDPVQEAIDRLLDELGDPLLVATLVTIFLDELPSRRSAIVDATAGGDLDTVRRTAHTLKSTSAMLGAADLAAVATELEARAKSDDGPIDELVADLESAGDEAAARLERVLGSLGEPQEES